MGKIRVIVAKVGLDGHDRGAKVVARALRDAGVEVIYTGLHQTPEQIVAAAIQEDVDIVVFGGGIIPDADIAELSRMGVAKIFTPGASTTDIVAWVRAELGHRVTEEPGAASLGGLSREA
jgi:methylmalonyl-CoA mutase C-terminal domain/subunit